MEVLVFSLKIVAPLFIMMALGYLLARVKLIDSGFTGRITKFCFKFAMPVLQMYNMYKADLVTDFRPKVILWAVFCVMFIIAVTWLTVPRIVKEKKIAGVIIQASYRSNFLLFALHIMNSLYGDEAMGMTSVLIAVITAVYNFMAVVILSHFGQGDEKPKLGKTLLEIALNPLILGTLAGVILSLTNINLGSTLEGVMDDIGGLVTPLMLIALGGQFTFKSAKKHLKYIATCVSMRLLVAPLLMVGLGILVGFRGMELGLLLAMSASPVAVASFAMADQYKCDAPLAGEAVVFTSAFSTFTIFAWVFVLKTLSLI